MKILEDQLKTDKQKHSLFLTHHRRELTECFAMKGWGDGQYQQVQKALEHILGHEVHRQTLKGTGMHLLSNILSLRITEAIGNG